jgi:hypothetical protein
MTWPAAIRRESLMTFGSRFNRYRRRQWCVPSRREAALGAANRPDTRCLQPGRVSSVSIGTFLAALEITTDHGPARARCRL